MRKRFGVLALLGFASSAFLAGAIKVGDRAPEIRFDKLLPDQPVANASFQALAGKAVVLEFWATWCAPCVEAIPHLNELAQKFKDRPIVFLSVLDEDPDAVEAFLKKQSVVALVGIAHTQRPQNAYCEGVYPRTFLIDATGKVAAITYPRLLKEPALEDLLAGRPPSVPSTLPGFGLSLELPRDESGPAALLHVAVRPGGHSHGPWPIRGGITGANTAEGENLRSVVSSVFGVPENRITGQPLEEPAVYDFSLVMSGASRAEFQSKAREALATVLKLQVNREIRETDVWIMAKLDGKPAALAEPPSKTTSMWISQHGSINLKGCDMSALANQLESATGKPVIDETGITGKFDFTLTYDAHDPQGAVAVLRKLGFKVGPAHRPIEFLVVTKAE